MKCRREIGEHPHIGFFSAQKMPLQLDIDAVPAEEANQMIQRSSNSKPFAQEQIAACKRNEPARMPVELIECESALPFRRTQFHASNQTTEIAIAFLSGDEDGERRERNACGRC